MQSVRQLLWRVQIPFQRLPESSYKQRVRIQLWRYAAAGIIHPTIHLLRRPLLLSSGDNVILVGCSSNQTLREVSELVGPSGSVLIIEPSEDIRDTLCTATVDTPVAIDGRGAWSDTGTLIFGKSDDDKTAGRVLDADANHEWTKADYDNTISVEASQLSTIADEYEFVPDYIELMTNGTEPEVLSGATSLLQRATPKILIKTYGFGGSDTGSRIDALLTQLNELDYKYVFAPTRPFPGQIPPWGADGDIFAWYQ